MARTENIIDVSEATFEDEVILRSHDLPVVVDFWAAWCGPCRMLGPVLERLAADPGYDFILAKLDVDANPNISMRYQVQGIPAVKAFVNGQVASEFVGALPEPRVRDFLRKLTPSEADLAFRQASSLLATHHWLEAADILEELLEEHPYYPGAVVALARAMLAQGEGCGALPLLEQMTDGADLLLAQRLTPLAQLLCRVGSEEVELDADDSPVEAQYRQAGRLLGMGNLEAAMDGLLDVLRLDKRHRNGEPREVLLALFELLGEDDTLTQSYRRELASVLF